MVSGDRLYCPNAPCLLAGIFTWNKNMFRARRRPSLRIVVGPNSASSIGAFVAHLRRDGQRPVQPAMLLAARTLGEVSLESTPAVVHAPASAFCRKRFDQAARRQAVQVPIETPRSGMGLGPAVP